MSITSRINEMSSHIEQAYDELQGLGADLTNVNKNIENISMVLDDIYDSMPQVSGEGTNLTLDDTRVGKIKSTLKGNTSQTTYSGKNLLPNDTETKTRNGITITKNSDGTYKINGTATSDVSEAICNSFIPMSGTWRMLGCPSGGSASTYMLSAYVGYWGEGSPNIDTGNGTNITYTGNVKVRFYIKSGTTCNNLIFKPMLTTDTSTTINDFEPYVGGTPSPNPSYPQPVNVVSGDNEIKICGKNLFDKDNANILNAYFETSTPNLSSNDNARTLYIECLPNTTYTIEKLRSQQFNVGCTSTQPVIGTTIQKIGNGPLGVYDGNTEVNYTYTTNSTAKYLLVRYAYATQVDLDLMLSSIQIEYGPSASEKEPYQGNTYNIDLPVENLFDKDNTNYVNGWIDGRTMRLNTINGNRMFYMPCKPNTTYTISRSIITSSFRTTTYDSTPFPTVTGSNVDYTVSSVLKNDSGTTLTITTGANAKYLVVHYGKIEDTNLNETLATIQVEYGSKANSYTPYGTTPIELCKIGTYQDYFYKDSDKWYLHKEIGKVVLNGSEGNWNGWYNTENNNIGFYNYLNGAIAKDNSEDTINGKAYCNKFSEATNRTDISNGIEEKFKICGRGNEPSYLAISLSKDKLSDWSSKANAINSFKSWLASNNPIVYYILATPTTTEITYQPLIDQLNLLEKAMSKDGQTNISQINNDLPFIISASALKEWQESTSLNSTLSMVNPLSLGNTLNTQENDIQPIEVDNIEPLEEEENEES